MGSLVINGYCESIPTSSYKSIMARYLLQIRYFEKSNTDKLNNTDKPNNIDKPIQECISILRNKNITNIDICHVSYIWNYDGYLDKTWVTLNFSPFLTTDERQSLVDYIKKDFDITNDDDDDEQKGNRLVLSGKGLIHIIE
jgi:hypothetical protein